MPQQKSAYPECRHILTTGRKCQGPALRGRRFCHHHAHRRNLAARNQRSLNSVQLPPLEDHSSVVLAIDQIVFALTHRRITDQLAARLLYAIQLAQNSLNRIKEVAPEDMVTDYVNGPFGDIAAPEDPNADITTSPVIPSELTASERAETGVPSDRSSSLGWEGPVVAFQGANPTEEPSAQPSAEPAPTPAEPNAADLTRPTSRTDARQ